MRSCFDSLAVFYSSVAALGFSVAVLTGCASSPPAAPTAANPHCAVDFAANELRCDLAYNPTPGVPDSGSTTRVTISFADGAFDGATRVIDGVGDHVTTLWRGYVVVDPSGLAGFDAGVAHDPAIEDVVVWLRLPLVELEPYERAEISGEVAIDAAGHGHVDMVWSDPPSGAAQAGTLSAEF